MPPAATTDLDLVRRRNRHAPLAVALLLPLVVLTRPGWVEGGVAHETLEWLGYAAIIVCVLGRAWCTAYIGGRKKQEVVDRGPYSVVRNPLYLFSFLGIVGVGLLTGSTAWTALLATGFAAYCHLVVRREEAFLLKSFPMAYGRYLARTPRWIPDVRLWRDLDELSIRPALIARTLRDGACFFAAFPLLEALDAFHATGAIPTLLVLP